MHPVLLLESKIACLKGLDQEDRQDEKHAKMAVCFSACFIKNMIDEIRRGEISPSFALTAAEHVHRIARTDAGLHAWRHYGLLPELAIPREAFQTCHNEKLGLFMERRLPQLEALLGAERAKMSSRVEARHLDRFPAVRPNISLLPTISPEQFPAA
jgi:hypothetical protein